MTNSYTYGWLTSVTGYTGTAPGQAAGVGITYYPNGMVKDVAHSNGVVDTQANDPNGMTRPASITASLSARASRRRQHLEGRHLLVRVRFALQAQDRVGLPGHHGGP